MFIQHAEQTRVLDNGQWTLVEADVPSRSIFAQTFLHRALQCNVGGVEVLDNVYARVLDNGQWMLVEADVPSRFETL